MKFSMWRTRGHPILYLFSRWWKDGTGHRDVRRERWRWQKERRSPNPPEYYRSLFSVMLQACCCGDIGGEMREGTGAWCADLQHVRALPSSSSVPWWAQPREDAGRTVMKRAGCQSDRKVISRGDQSQTWRLLACQPQLQRHRLSSLLPDHQFCHMAAYSRISFISAETINWFSS